MKTGKQTAILIAVLFLYLNSFAQTALTPVSSFGSNPGNLKMFYYVPAGMATDTVSLVVAIHGCTQSASAYALQTGWNKLADRHKFIVLYPEQQTANNQANCFNWFDSLYQVRDQFEVLSIKQMVDYMKSNYTFDTTKIFITGLSAGGGMTSNMMATYPELFRKGAVMAGIPYKIAVDTNSAFTAMGGSVTKTAAQWGALVKKQNPNFTGSYPDVAVFHGTNDFLVNITNAKELVKQWTSVNKADQIADDSIINFEGDTAVSRFIYNDSLNNPVVYYYRLKGLGHGIAVDTGSCPRQGGATSTYALKGRFHSTYWAADFFGLLKQPYSITGKTLVTQNANGIVYSVLNAVGSQYNWTVPSGASIVSGQGTNSILVNFASKGGLISVQEMSIDSCINDIASLNVSVLNFGVQISQTSGIACNGLATAALTATVVGGTAPFTYLWSVGAQTNASISGLKAGTYTITVTDNSSAVISNTFKVLEPPLNSTSQTLTICSGTSIIVGSTIHSTTGTFTDILTSFKGCDSTVITTLTVSPPKAFTQSFTKCPGGSVTVGSITYNTTGTYTVYLTGFKGCDSVVITHLTILPANSVTQSLTVCPGQSITVGTTTHNATGTYTDVLTSFKGCDSTVITNLTVLPANIHTQGFVICQGQSVTVGNSNYTSTGTYTNTISSFRGCDSTVITNVLVQNEITFNQTLTICNGDNIKVGKIYHNKTGVYSDTLKASFGCDSIVITDLKVREPIDVSVTISPVLTGLVLYANNKKANYQWIKCPAENEIISLATAQSYTPTVKGSYAVIVSDSVCADTSFCLNTTTATFTEITELINDLSVTIYPNPFAEYTNIEFANEQQNTHVKIVDVLGAEIISINVTGKHGQIEKGDLKEGVYFVQIIDLDNNMLNKKIVVQ